MLHISKFIYVCFNQIKLFVSLPEIQPITFLSFSQSKQTPFKQQQFLTMSDDKNKLSQDSDSDYKQPIPSNKMENTQQKQDDPLNKYSFSSYHMNIISGNNHVQTTPTGPSPQMRENQFMNYSYQPHYQQPNHYVPNDLQLLINNMFTVLNNQSKLLSYLIEKNDHNFFTTNKIYSELKTIKKEEVQEPEPFQKHLKKPNYSCDVTANDLVGILYGPKTTFKYKLVVDSKVPFETPLYRQRNFKLKINLIDENGKLFPNSNRIPISLALYTVQNPPKFLQSNTLGNKMLKGYSEQDLLNGICMFEKIQIKEVTSHYRKNMLFLVAFAKVPSMGSNQDVKCVDYQQIRPLVVDRVIVKAKKMKRQDAQKEVEKIDELENEDEEEEEEDEVEVEVEVEGKDTSNGKKQVSNQVEDQSQVVYQDQDEAEKKVAQ